jgi:1-acyl-sn-glycerol-3-phosphate acyltransferase
MVIFPEGTRSTDGELQQAKAGIGLLACRSRAQVLPVRVFGAHNVYSRKHKIPNARGRIKIVYGKCLQPDEFDPGKGTDERYQVAINRIMGAIKDLKKPNDFAG